MQLQDFLEKARVKKDNEAKVIKIEIKDLGAVEFVKPTIKEMTEYMDKLEKDLPFSKVLEQTKEMLYLHCPILQKKEVREAFVVDSPFDLVTELFGMIEVTEVFEKFMISFGFAEEIKKDKKEEDEAIKN